MPVPFFPIRWAKAVARGLLDSLAEGGRFSILSFAGTPHDLTRGLVAANSWSVSTAQKTIDDIEAVAMRHPIASRRTSLVAVSEEPSVDPRAPRGG